MDPMQNLNDAAAAMNALAERAAGFYDDADAQIAARQAAYDAMAGNFAGVIASEMHWQVTFDPDAIDLADGNGGTYASLRQVMLDAPRGGMVTITVPTGRVIDIADTEIPAINQLLHLQTTYGAAASRLRFPTLLNSASNNTVARFRLQFGGLLSLQNIELEALAKTDAAEEWAQNGGSMIQADFGQFANVQMKDVTVIGTEGVGFINGRDTHVNAIIKDSTLDGDLDFVTDAANGTSNVATSSVTLLNGARMHSTGTVGTNMLTNN